MQVKEVSNLITRIQQAVAYGEQSSEDELIELAGEHEDAIAYATQRLEPVIDYIERGLVSEAIALADTEPVLPDLLAELDFFELEEWNALLESQTIQVVAQVPTHLLEVLNDAYTSEASTKKLLQRFRAASLVRKPLLERTAILKRLAKKDPDNALWSDNVVAYETALLKQVPDQLRRLVDSQDLHGLRKLNEQLQEPWSVKVPAALKKQTATSFLKLQAADAQRQLRPVADDLSTAFSEFDVDSGTGLANKFRTLERIAQLPPNHELYTVAGPALDWVDTRLERNAVDQRRQQAINELTMALDEDAGEQELQSIYYRATEGDEVLPEALQTRLNNHIETKRIAAKRKQTSVIVSIVAVSSLLVLAVGYGVRTSVHNSEVKGHATRLAELLKEGEQLGDLTSPNDYVRQLEETAPQVLEAPDVAALKSKLDGLRNTEQDRKSRLTELLAATKPAAETHDQWELFPLAEAKLKESRKLVKNNEEQLQIDRAEAAVNKSRAQLQTVTDSAFSDELRDIAAKLKVLPEEQSAYAPFISRLTALKGRKHVSPGLIVSVESLLEKATEERAMIRINGDISLQLQAITATVGDANRYRSAIKSYMVNHGQTARAADFKTSSSEQPVWEAVDQWADLREELTEVAALSAYDARKLVARYEDFVRQHGVYPDPNVPKRMAAIKLIAARVAGKESIPDTIQRIFAATIFANCYCLDLEDGKRYYASSAPYLQGEKIRVDDYFTASKTMAGRGKSFATRQVTARYRKPPASPEDWVAPQTLVTKKVIEPILESQKIEQAFEESMRDICVALTTQERMDEVLKLLLLEAMLQLGSSGSEFLRTESVGVLDRLAKINVSRTSNWAAPSGELKNERKICARRMPQIVKEMTLMFERAIRLRNKELSKQLTPEMVWVGWLHRDMQREWTVSFKDAAPQNAELFCFTKTQANELVRATVGSIKNGVSAIGPLAQSDREGRPVFIEKQP